MASNVDMPFRFLDLAPELRNHIYNFATSTLTTPVKLSHRSARTSEPHAQSVLALTQVSKQIRAEYQPLYMAAAEIHIDLSDTEPFLSTFSSAPTSGVSTSPPRNICVNIQPCDTSIDRLLDMRPFFLALTRTLKPQWYVRTGRTISSTPLKWRMTQIEEALELAGTILDAFLRSIASSSISGITFQQMRDELALEVGYHCD